ncbi:MAG TPA: outer membrane beta-barrel protein [Bryobacteraceae bacterium]|nr:outer membrane beta-barrel protein [Bryobacteraceae bacterium]
MHTRMRRNSLHALVFIAMLKAVHPGNAFAQELTPQQAGQGAQTQSTIAENRNPAAHPASTAEADTVADSASQDNGSAPNPANLLPAAPKVEPDPVASPAAVVPNRGFWKRLAKAYYDDWRPVANSEESKFRGYPPVESNPPYPFSVWPIGGTVWIGYNNSTAYPLTTALQTGPHGDWWKKANIQIYGWADAGLNFSSSTEAVGGKYANSPAAYNQIPNSIQLDQFATYIERTPDTVQKDHFDWGFRFTSLYGGDYRFTTSKGIFSQQLLTTQPDGTLGKQYGWDPVMAYIDLYFPKVADGMILRVGRYVSLPDIEAQLAPNNYTYTHSLTYTYDCYTQQGVNATIKLNNHWTWQGGISPGCDTAPWKTDAKLTFNTCLQYMWREGMDDIYACSNSMNDSKYAYNNLAAYYLTWYHKINAKWHTDFESWYQYMRKTPNIYNPVGRTQVETNSNGAWCNQAYEVTCFAPEWAFLNYTNRQLGPRDFISARNEFFDDLRGQRTGYKGRYVETGISWNHWIGSTIVLRPELRWEHNFDNPAYDGGNRHSQFMFAADVIWFF